MAPTAEQHVRAQNNRSGRYITNVEKSMQVTIDWNEDEGFEVSEEVNKKYIVHLEAEKCSCRAWDLKGIPCAHAIAAMSDAGRKSQAETDNPKIDPPVVKMPGRPKKDRKKEVGEIKRAGKLPKRGITMICSICKEANHNKRGCPKNLNPKTKAKATPEFAESQQSSIVNPKKRNRGILVQALKVRRPEVVTRNQGLWDMMYLFRKVDVLVLIKGCLAAEKLKLHLLL